MAGRSFDRVLANFDEKNEPIPEPHVGTLFATAASATVETSFRDAAVPDVEDSLFAASCLEVALIADVNDASSESDLDAGFGDSVWP